MAVKNSAIPVLSPETRGGGGRVFASSRGVEAAIKLEYLIKD